MKRLALIILIVIQSNLTTYTPNLNEKYTLKTNWSSFKMVVWGFLRLQIHSIPRKEIRTITKEKMLLSISSHLENSVISDDAKIRDLLNHNMTFAQQYSTFLQSLELGSIFFQFDGIKSNMIIPLRGKTGLLGFLPAPWSQEDYQILEESSELTNAYYNKKVRGEFYRSLAPVSYTGLLIDATQLILKEALLPRIYSQDGRLIYGPEFVQRRVGIQRGLVSYVYNSKDVEINRRAGKHPLMTAALTTKGKNSTNLVISLEDTTKLLDHKQTAINLKKCRVVIIKKP